jgi:hypothetical protein
MTRRNAILATALLTGAITNNLKAQQLTGTTSLKFIDPNEKYPVLFNLRTYKAYTFTLDGQSVTFTPEQIMAALES